MRKLILIADDNKLCHKVYAEVLAADYDLLHTFDGADTLKAAFAHLPDLVILDIIMPLLDGREACKKLREDPRTRDVKVLMLSAKDTQFDRLVGLEVGADEYIEKPCSPEYLKSAIDKLFRGR